MAKATIRSLARTGFGLGVGVMGAQILFLLIGAAIFIPGYLLVTGQKKEEEKSDVKRVSGLVLMGIGVLIMGGVGFGFLLENLTE